MPYTRRILLYDRDLETLRQDLSAVATTGCWFELHRQGGCGAGEVRLRQGFEERTIAEIGEWIALEYDVDQRWYLGRIDSREAVSPSEVLLRLNGMSVELGEVFPGGFAQNSGASGLGHPLRFADTNLFGDDPDFAQESAQFVSSIPALVDSLMTDYAQSVTHIHLPIGWCDVEEDTERLRSVKFRGEESIRSIFKDLAMRAGNASWGVDASGDFFFRQMPSEVALTFQEGLNLVTLEESRDHQTLFNRLLLTGDFVYDSPDADAQLAQRTFRWRGHYVQPASRQEYGDRRIRIWIPWIRTRSDARAFAEEFFRRYSQPQNRYRIETLPSNELLNPWVSTLRLLDRHGEELFSSSIETVRVLFDHAPRFIIETGPDDPRTHWPEPENDERYEIPRNLPDGYGGDVITFPINSDGINSDGLSGGSSEEDSSSLISSEWTSGFTSDFSEMSSGDSSELDSDASSEDDFSGWLSSSSGGWHPSSSLSSEWTSSDVNSFSGDSSGETDVDWTSSDEWTSSAFFSSGVLSSGVESSDEGSSSEVVESIEI